MPQGFMWGLSYAICCAIGIHAHPLETDGIGAQWTSFSTQIPTLTVTTNRSGANQTLFRTPGSSGSSDATPTSTSLSTVPNNTGSSGIPTGTTIGAAVGGGVSGLLICSLLVCWVLKRRKNNKRRLINSATSSKKPLSEKGRTSAELKAPASSTATSEATDSHDTAHERLRTMHKASTA